ncbi:Structural maintenance of chromosomes protein [Entamoeba marina]
MWKINRLTLTDFKSYKGKHVIPEFKNFQAIIGPNGAGKSNLMDAICFVFGVRVGYLRGNKLNDLIHEDETLESQAKKATVEIELIHKKWNRKEIFKKCITSEKEYQKELKDLNIDVKARNFLVFQGDVVEVASKTGKELTKLIESISGSEELGVQYEELKKEKERAEEHMMTSMKEEAEECEKLEEELNDKKKELMLVDIRHFEKGMNKYINEEKEKKKKVEELLQDKIEKEGKFDEITQNLRKLENNEKTLRDNIRKERERELALYNQKSIDEENRLKELNAELNKKEDVLKTLKERETVILSDKQKVEFEKLNEKYQSSYGSKEVRCQELKQLVESDTLLKDELKSSDSIDIINEQIKSIDRQVERYQETITREKEQQELDNKEFELSKQKLKDKGSTIETISHELKEVEKEMSDVRIQLKQSKHDIIINETLENLKRLFSKVHGQVNELYSPINKRDSNILSLAIGKYGNAVVVDDTETAMECLRYCKEQRTKVVLTFLCLKELQSKDFYELDDELKEMGVNFAIRKIKFNDKYESVFKFVLNNTLMVNTLATARTIAFNKTYSHKFRIITSVGSVIEKNSLMVGGMVENKKLKGKVNTKKLQEQYSILSNKKLQLEEDLKSTQQIQISDVEELQYKVKGHIERIEVLTKRMNEVNTIKEQHNKEKNVLMKKSGGKNYKEIMKRLNANSKELTSLQNELDQIQKDIFKKLNTECRIDNVYIACSDSSRRARETEEFELSKDIELLKEKIQLEENKNSSTLKMELEQELASNQNILNNEIKQQEIEIENQLVTANENIENLYGKLKAGLDEIIRKSRLEQIDLPILNETQTQASKVTMDLLTQSTAITIPQYDYSIIDKLKVRNLEEYNKIRNSLIQDIQTIEIKINGLTPNMKAIDQFNGIKRY